MTITIDILRNLLRGLCEAFTRPVYLGWLCLRGFMVNLIRAKGGRIVLAGPVFFTGTLARRKLKGF